MPNNSPYAKSNFHLGGFQGYCLACLKNGKAPPPPHPVTRSSQGWWGAAPLAIRNESSGRQLKRPNPGCHACCDCHTQKHAARRRVAKVSMQTGRWPCCWRFKNYCRMLLPFAKFSQLWGLQFSDSSPPRTSGLTLHSFTNSYPVNHSSRTINGKLQK